MVRIVILENHPTYSEGLRYFITTLPDFSVVGVARTGSDFFRLLAGTPADLALVGVNLPDSNNCADVARRLRKTYPAMKIFAIANEDTRPIVQSMMKAGINGFIGKRQVKVNEFEKVIRKIAAGEQYIGRIDTNAHLRTSKIKQHDNADQKNFRRSSIKKNLRKSVSSCVICMPKSM
jgi:DNA-binding NarL/FixJ family response regulator